MATPAKPDRSGPPATIRSRRSVLKLAAAGGLSMAAGALPARAAASETGDERNVVVYLPGVDGLEAGDALAIRRTDGKVEKYVPEHRHAAGVHAFLPQRGRKGNRLIPVAVAGVARVKAEPVHDSVPIPGLSIGAGPHPGITTLGGPSIGIVLEPLPGGQAGLIRVLITGAR